MTTPASTPASRNESKEISDLRITINIIRDFLTLVELIPLAAKVWISTPRVGRNRSPR